MKTNSSVLKSAITKFSLGLITLLIISIMFGYQTSPLQALTSVDVTLSTIGPPTADEIKINVHVLLPSDITAYTMEINYNHDAFSLSSAQATEQNGPASTYTADDSKLTLSGENNGSSLSAGEHDLWTITLKPLAPGVSSIALITSSFTAEDGSSIPGTVLRFLSLEVPEADTAKTKEDTAENKNTAQSGSSVEAASTDTNGLRTNTSIRQTPSADLHTNASINASESNLTPTPNRVESTSLSSVTPFLILLAMLVIFVGLIIKRRK